MKAAVLRAFGDPLVIEEATLSGPANGEVRVRIAAVAICGSDLHAIDGGWDGQPPVVYGHEAAGVVVEIGPGVTEVEPGDPVVVTLLRVCRSCFYCVNDQSHLCETTFPLDTGHRIRDASGRPIAQGLSVGAFAEEVVVHASQAVPIDHRVPLDAAALLGCGVPTGFGAVVNTARVPAGATVVVVGAGGVGVNCLQGASAAGAATVVAVDVNAAKLDAALRFGATHRLEAGPTLVEDVAGLTAGRGADFAFVAVGSTSAVESAFECVRPGGTMVVVGMSAAGRRSGFDMSEFAYSGKRILGSRMGSTDFARDIPVLAARYLAGDLYLDELISGRFTLDEIDAAVDAARAGDTMRNVVVFEGVAA